MWSSTLKSVEQVGRERVREVMALRNLSCFSIFWDSCLCLSSESFLLLILGFMSLFLSLLISFCLGDFLKWGMLVRREKERELDNPSLCLVCLCLPSLRFLVTQNNAVMMLLFGVLFCDPFSFHTPDKSVCYFVITIEKVNPPLWALTINFSCWCSCKYRYEVGRRGAREHKSVSFLLMGLSLKMQCHHPVALRLHDQMGSKRKYTFIQAHRAWLPKFFLLWILLMALISCCIYSKMDDDTKVRRKEVLGSLCDQRARMLQDQFSVSVNHVHALAILVSTFHYYRYPSAIDQVSAWIWSLTPIFDL